MMNTVWLVTTALLLSCHLGTAPRFRRTSSSESTPLLAEPSTEDAKLFLGVQPMAYKPKLWDTWYGSTLRIHGGASFIMYFARSERPLLVLVELPTPHADLDIHATPPKTTAFSLDDTDLSKAMPFTTGGTVTATGSAKNDVQYVATRIDLNALIYKYSNARGVVLIACKGDGVQGADRLTVKRAVAVKTFNMAFQRDMARSKPFYGFRMYFDTEITPPAK